MIAKTCSRLRRRALSALLACALLCAPAAAAEGAEHPATVELNGVEVQFTDAYPRNEGGRVFVPYRALFEALGAEVSWEGETGTAVAVRGDATVRVPIGSTEIYIHRGDTVEVLEMDVASYIEAGSGRTYVPVRFMAQAMGCLVGWDGDDQTVILVDHGALAEEAVSRNSYIILESGRPMQEPYLTGNWAIEGEVLQIVEAKGMAIATTAGAFSGLYAAGAGSQLFLELEADWSAGYRAEARARGVSLEELLEGLGMEEAGLYASMSAEQRTNEATGRNGLRLSAASGAAGSLPTGVWLEGDGALLGGVDVSGLLGGSWIPDPAELVKEGLEALELTDHETAVEQVRLLAGTLAGNLSDHAVRTSGLVQTLRWTAGEVSHTLTFYNDSTWANVGMEWIRVSADGTSHVTLDDAGNLTETVTVTSGEQTTTVTQSCRYTPSAIPPETALSE